MRLPSTACPYVFYHLPGRPPGDACVVPVVVGGRTACPRWWPSVGRPSAGPSWDLDKQPFVFVDAFVSQCGDLPTMSTWTHRPTLFLTYLFSVPASRLIPLLCAFYFTQRTRSKWRKAILDGHSGPARQQRAGHWNLGIISDRVMYESPGVPYAFSHRLLFVIWSSLCSCHII